MPSTVNQTAELSFSQTWGIVVTSGWHDAVKYFIGAGDGSQTGKKENKRRRVQYEMVVLK